MKICLAIASAIALAYASMSGATAMAACLQHGNSFDACHHAMNR